MSAVYTLAAVAIATAAPAWDSWEPPTPRERALVEASLATCRSRTGNGDAWQRLRLLRLETHPMVRVPERWRGMVLAAACNESRFAARAIGDGGLALGLLQLHHFHRAGRRGCNLDPETARRRVRSPEDAPDSTQPTGNALCWLWRIRQAYDGERTQGMRRRCAQRRPGMFRGLGKISRDDRAWLATWGWIAGGRRSCSEVPEGHLRWWFRLAR